jgi:hypothetical protein
MLRLILSVLSSDLPGVNPATLNGMILYYRLMTKWSGLADSTELSRMGLSHRPALSLSFLPHQLGEAMTRTPSAPPRGGHGGGRGRRARHHGVTERLVR